MSQYPQLSSKRKEWDYYCSKLSHRGMLLLGFKNQSRYLINLFIASDYVSIDLEYINLQIE